MSNLPEILSKDSTYHIFNRANGSEKIFIEPENYRFFLQQYQLYVSHYVDTFCYCLMPNHFHLLVRIKDEDEWPVPAHQNLPGLAGAAGLQNPEGLSPAPTPGKIISHQFSRFFNSYTKAYNKLYARKGSLFIKNFKRIQVNDEPYLKKLVHYIHHNPVKAGLCQHPREWPHSSYQLMLEDKHPFVKTHEVAGWFDDLENFKAFHKLSSQLQETD